MLTAIEIENFKGVREPVRIEIRPITLFFGPNSAGKSSVLQALHYAREILERGNADPVDTAAGGRSVDLGGFHNCVHGRDPSRRIRLRLELDLSRTRLRQYDLCLDEPGPHFGSPYYSYYFARNPNSGWIQLEVGCLPGTATPRVVGFEVGLEGERVARLELSEDGDRVEYCAHNSENAYLRRQPTTDDDEDGAARVYHEDDGYTLRELREEEIRSSPALPDRIPCETGTGSALPQWDAVPDGAPKDHHGAALCRVGEIARNALRCFRYVGPLRAQPTRAYLPPSEAEERRWAEGLAAWDLLREGDGDLVAAVDAWLSDPDRLDTGYGVRLREFKEVEFDGGVSEALGAGRLDGENGARAHFERLPTRRELRIRDVHRGLQHRPFDVGVGISQLLPVVVAALAPPERPPSLIAIEQPELHVHPRVQVGLGDLFAAQIRDGRRFLLETHSEHLMLRVLRRIEETGNGELPAGAPALHPGDVSVVYFQSDRGRVRATPLRIDPTGEFIDRWPEGFFAERVEELT